MYRLKQSPAVENSNEKFDETEDVAVQKSYHPI